MINKVILLNFFKMIKNRNIEIYNKYSIKNLIEKNITEELINVFFKNNINIVDNKEKIYVSFIDKKIGVKEIKLKILDNLENKEFDKLIIITKYKLNSYVINKLNSIEKEIEIFTYNSFYMNLIDHFLVPKHKILDLKHEKLIKEKFNSKLPLIKKSDPICRYYDCKNGQVLKIYRKNEIYYRLVCN